MCLFIEWTRFAFIPYLGLKQIKFYVIARSLFYVLVIFLNRIGSFSEMLMV